MAQIVEKELGFEGIAYIERCLERAHGLSSELRTLPLRPGRAFTPVPAQIDATRLMSFNVGGVTRRRETNVWLLSHLYDLWRVEGTGTFIVQDIWAKPSDRILGESVKNRFVSGSNVYYFMQETDASLEKLESIFRALVSFLLVGVFTKKVIYTGELSSSEQAVQGVIDIIADGAKEIFVSAYDQEGFVVLQL